MSEEILLENKNGFVQYMAPITKSSTSYYDTYTAPEGMYFFDIKIFSKNSLQDTPGNIFFICNNKEKTVPLSKELNDFNNKSPFLKNLYITSFGFRGDGSWGPDPWDVTINCKLKKLPSKKEDLERKEN